MARTKMTNAEKAEVAAIRNELKAILSEARPGVLTGDQDPS